MAAEGQEFLGGRVRVLVGDITQQRVTAIVSSIAFPSISTGAFGYPRHEAAAISSQAIKEFLSADDVLKEVRLVIFQQGDARAFLENQKFG